MSPDTRHPVVRVLSKLGVCSRMQAVELVLAGRVRLGGRLVRDPGERCLFSDPLEVDGQAVSRAPRRYLLLNKPRGVVTTRSDERGRRTVYDLIAGADEWLVPVGRLDRDSEGLLVLTNDTRFSAWLTDPANALPRVYQVTIRPAMTAAEVEALTDGVEIGKGEISRPAAARLLTSTGESAILELTLTEGRNREVRRLFRTRLRRVTRLVRTSFGPFRLGELAPGSWQEAPITEAEARRLVRVPFSPP